MFKTLNPYLVLTFDSTPKDGAAAVQMVRGIKFGQELSETELLMDATGRGEYKYLPWTYIAPIRLFSQEKKGVGKINVSLSMYYLDVARLILAESARWKDPLPTPLWNPGDPSLQHLSPYLRVADLADFRARLAEDIDHLNTFKPYVPDWMIAKKI